MFKYDVIKHYHDKDLNFDIGNEIILSGWIDSIRHHSKLSFFDIRNVMTKTSNYILQCIIKNDNKDFNLAKTLKNEYVIRITGYIKARDAACINNKEQFGDRELHVTSLLILNTAQVPYYLKDKVNETTSLTYRYYDLRNPNKAFMIRKRAEVVEYIHAHFGTTYTYIDTPILTKSTPEGARDFLVFSRNYPGSAYALPQSPQLFKQMLMMSGISNKYYQIARCFRDEDLRANRQPEFTQIDVEMSFVNTSDVTEAIEQFFIACARDIFNVNISNIPTITYDNAIKQFGNDSPDLRIECLRFYEINEILQQDPLQRSVCMKFPIIGMEHNIDVISSKLSEILVEYNKLSMFGYIVFNKEPIFYCNKDISSKVFNDILKACDGSLNEIVIFGSDININMSFTELRKILAREFQLLREGIFPIWVNAFPMFGLKNQEGDIEVLHHPFTSPIIDKIEDLDTVQKETLLNIKANAYDLVVNGEEICGGSMRTINPNVLVKILQILGYSIENIEDKFGFFITAMHAGTPPHGGFAFGLERLLMVFLGESNIRSIIPFPKTQTGHCLLTNSPSTVDENQVLDLHLNIIKGTDV